MILALPYTDTHSNVEFNSLIWLLVFRHHLSLDFTILINNVIPLSIL